MRRGTPGSGKCKGVFIKDSRKKPGGSWRKEGFYPAAMDCGDITGKKKKPNIYRKKGGGIGQGKKKKLAPAPQCHDERKVPGSKLRQRKKGKNIGGKSSQCGQKKKKEQVESGMTRGGNKVGGSGVVGGINP